jgi:hypothetical protein
VPYYKDANNHLHFLENEVYAHLLPVDCVEISDAEAASIQAPTPDQVKSEKWESIKSERDRRKAGGVMVEVGADNKWFHSDDASRIQQIGLVMMGAGIPAGLQWKTMDGSFIAMNQTVAGAVFSAVAASDQAIFAVAETHRAAMESSTDPASYDYSTGWPKIYGG